MSLSRRELLLALGPLLAGLPGCRRGAGREEAAALVAFVEAREDWTALGRSLLALGSARPSPAEVAGRLRRRLEDVGPVAGGSPLAALVAGEHRRGETVRVEGWRLSRSEADLAVLVALA